MRLKVALAFAMAFGMVACDTHAVGVEECQTIEQARCIAARACKDGIDSDSDEAECQRFSRDNCLHGLPIAQAPRSSDLQACVADIQAAGTCAAQNSKLRASSCAGIAGTVSSKTGVCDVVDSPENSSACAFLVPSAPPIDAGTD